MIKVGDKVRRKANHRDYFWCSTCYMSGHHIDGEFAVSLVNEVVGSITIREFDRYFDLNCFELAEQNKIKVGDVFKDGYGRSVRIIYTDAKGNLTIVGLRMADGDNDKEIAIQYMENGITWTNEAHSPENLILPWNQVPKTDWSKVATDTLIKIINIDGYRYFSHYINDKVWYYAAGTTSRTYTDILPVGSEYCELIEETK